jgi:hypothetical protein
VANAPTRPPGRSRYGRRPPRGPRLVPLSRRDQDRVEQLRQASAHLRETGAPKLADAVDFVLTDEGANFIGRLRWKETADENPNLALSMPTVLRDAIKAGASAQGKNLTTQAVVALNAFLAGDFVPERPERGKPGTVAPKSNLNVRVNAELRARVDEHGRKLMEDGVLDWAPLTSHVLKAWYAQKFAPEFKAQ